MFRLMIYTDTLLISSLLNLTSSLINASAFVSIIGVTLPFSSVILLIEAGLSLPWKTSMYKDLGWVWSSK